MNENKIIKHFQDQGTPASYDKPFVNKLERELNILEDNIELNMETDAPITFAEILHVIQNWKKNPTNLIQGLAREELTKEAKRGAERAREIGAYGWVKRPGATTDKKFLGNVLVSTLRSNKRKPSRDQDHRPYRRKYEDKRDSYQHSRHSYHPRHHPIGRFSHTENGKNEEKVPEGKFKRKSDKDDSQGDKQTMSISDRLKDGEKEEMKEEISSEHDKSYQKELRKEHKKEFRNKKCRDDKKDRQKKTAKERRKKENREEEEAHYIHSDEEKVKITCDNSDSDLISEKTYYKDTGQGHRKRNISSKSEEESLLEDIKKHEDIILKLELNHTFASLLRKIGPKQQEENTQSIMASNHGENRDPVDKVKIYCKDANVAFQKSGNSYKA
ncbi:unnamed protein product [Mytilus coruscus]|uniref:Uncharacterized protein n=1 Tax=Mytilus coruscus TaxID=42192 RepID=A0A6J8CCJ5_MYTCO|nr:unnamed protein product [Mytilus coruscus]